MLNRRSFLKDAGLLTLGTSLLPSIGNFALADGFFKSGSLPRSTPEAQGISSAGIGKFLAAITESKQQFHSLMIVRHGHVVAEGWWAPFSSEHRQHLYSLSKSFTGTAVGLAQSEGLLSVEDPIIKFFPDWLPNPVSENLAALKIKHLLSMSVGHAKDSVLILEASAPGVPWEKTFLSLPVVYKPGTQFLYNSGASFMLSAIVQKVTGKRVHDYLKPRLYDPLQFDNATWATNWEGINTGASDLRITTEEIAKFGQLYLQKGVWNGKQVISGDWVKAASSKQISNGNNDGSWAYGYGYQFWLNPPGGFRADGAFGQYSMILPELDAVVAITSESIDTKTTMQIVWDVLLPEMKSQTALPENTAAHAQLLADLKELKLPPPQLSPSSQLISKVSGKKYTLDHNPFNVDSVAFEFTGDKCVFTMKQAGTPDIVITHGINQWIRKGNRKPSPHSMFSLRRIDFDSIVAASAGWVNENTLRLTWRYLEAIHGDSVFCVFDGDKVTLKLLFSVNELQGKPDDRADIVGKVMA